MATRAIVRAPGSTYPEALTKREPRPAVDLELARRQHRGYVATLRHVGLEVTELPPDDGIRTPCSFRTGSASWTAARSWGPRRSSRAAARPRRRSAKCSRRSYPIVELPSPAFLDWGDVLITEGALFVGLSERSNEAAVEGLRDDSRLDAQRAGCSAASRSSSPAERVLLPRAIAGSSPSRAGTVRAVERVPTSFPSRRGSRRPRNVLVHGKARGCPGRISRDDGPDRESRFSGAANRGERVRETRRRRDLPVGSFLRRLPFGRSPRPG